MRFPFSLVLLLIIHSNLFSQELKNMPFVINGKISGKNSGYVYLFYPNNNKVINDSCIISKGQFSFNGYLTEPTEATISTFNFNYNNGSDTNENNLNAIYIEPGKLNLNILINHFKDIQVEGSHSDSDRVKLYNLKLPIENRIHDILIPFLKCHAKYKEEEKKNPKSETTQKLLEFHFQGCQCLYL